MKSPSAAVLALVSLLTFALIGHAAAEPKISNPTVILSTAQDVSPELRSIPPAPWPAGVTRLVPNLLLPLPAGSAAAGTMTMRDEALQATAAAASVPGPEESFDGIGVPDYSVYAAPPDPNGDVGLTDYVQIVNTAFAVFDKSSGNLLYGPVSSKTLWTGFGGGCEQNDDGDAVVKYDRIANRWIITQFSVSSYPYQQCVAVSTTSDPTGSYYRYSFPYSQFNDYPKLGVWPDAYYTTYNMFSFTSGGAIFQGSTVCAMDRTSMLSGGHTASQQCFSVGANYGGLLPADMNGTIPPATGSPDYIVNFGYNSLNVWKFRVSWTNPNSTSLTGPTSIPVAAFVPACNGLNCIHQPGTKNKLDSLADRLMYSLAYRNLGTSESLVVNHSVKVSGTNKSQVVGVRWYELRLVGGTPSLYQQGTFSPDSNSRWMGSMSMDKMGNIAVGYSVSSKKAYPSIRYTGRLASDPSGTLETEVTATTGSGSQLQKLHRWGDYSSMSVDPSDDCTFWYTTQYLKTSGDFNWSTRIISFKFPACQ